VTEPRPASLPLDPEAVGPASHRSATPPRPLEAEEARAQRARNLPLDAHLHTDQSPDSSVHIDLYAAAAVELGIAEIAITDHVDFDPRDPAYRYTSFEDRERVVRDAAERWATHGVTIRFGAELTYNRRWELDVRAHLRRHRYDYTIGSVHDWPESPYVPNRIRSFVVDRPLDEILEPYYAEVIAAARSGLFDTIGHLDVVKRYLHPHLTAADLGERLDLQDAALRAVVESGMALEVNSSGLRYPGGETYPSAAAVARFRELGGDRVVAGSDAHRADWFAFRLDVAYGHVAAAGFDSLAFRRGDRSVSIPLTAAAGTSA
jgi:histidinol-phosphatase (PHP family)